MVSSLVDANPDTLAVCEIHLLDAYTTTWGDERQVFYDALTGGIPYLVYDGALVSPYSPDPPHQDYAGDLAARQAVPTDVTLDLIGVETGAQTYDVTARVCVEAGGVGKTMRVEMVHALDHWPTTKPHYRNTLRWGAASQDLTVAAGDCADVTRSFAFDSTSWAQQSDIRIVAWAQTPATSSPAEVHQARVMSWPFPTVFALFVDGFESGDTGAWSNEAP